MKIELQPDDGILVDASSPILLSFVFAVVVGYFIGRTTGMRGRSSSDE
jgi:hypothetical protein